MWWKVPPKVPDESSCGAKVPESNLDSVPCQQDKKTNSDFCNVKSLTYTQNSNFNSYTGFCFSISE